MSKLHKRLSVGTLILHIFLIAGSLIMVFPFVWTLMSSFKELGQIFKIPPEFWPNPWVWTNFSKSLQAMPFGKAYFNSLYIAVVVVVCQMVTASMAGYAFGKLKFPGHNIVFLIFLSTMMIPSQVVMIPIFNNMNLILYM